MKESAQAALSYLQAHAGDLGIDTDLLNESDLHLHVPAGATPKEGPSAGVALAVTMLSLLTSRPVRADVAMTGEITLRGRVLPVGGIRDKVLAAQRAGIHTVVLPKRNEKDLEDVPEDVREALHFEPVGTFDEAMAIAFGEPSAPPAKGRGRSRAKRSATRSKVSKTASKKRAGRKATGKAAARKVAPKKRKSPKSPSRKASGRRRRT